MSLSVDTSTAPVSSMTMSGPTTTLHNSLATYMTQQVCQYEFFYLENIFKNFC